RLQAASCRSSTYEEQGARIFATYSGFSALSAFVLQDIQTGIRGGEVHDPLSIDEYVTGLNDLGRIGPLVDNSFRRRRHKITDLSRLKRLADIEDPQSRIVIGSE